MTTKMTVAETWATYQQDVLPKDAGPVQVQETRRAFYAGTYFLLLYLMHAFDQDTPDEEGVEHLEALKAECEAFAAAQPATHIDTNPITPPDVNYTIPDPLDMQAKLKELGTRIGEGLPDGWGFNLLLFSFGEKGLFYISNADRADVINVMKEHIRKQTQ